MFTQITIIKTSDSNAAEDEFKITFFNQDGVAYAEKIIGITEVKACIAAILDQMIADPRSAYAKS